MKRTGLPSRKTPLRRSDKPLKRTSVKRVTSALKVSARKSQPRRRAVPKPVADNREQVRAEVFARDGHRCRLRDVPGAGRCFGRLTYHHRRKDGQGGGYTVDNGASLCTRHNDELEADADLALLARTMGLVLKRGDVWTPAHDRFWALVDRDGPVPEHAPELGACWQWTGATQEAGRTRYGRWRPARDTPAVYAHRFALSCVEALVDGLEVDHLCRNYLCVHPRHLEQVVHAENVRRHYATLPAPTECKKAGHPFPDNLVVRGNGTTECRECMHVRQARWRQRKAAAR